MTEAVKPETQAAQAAPQVKPAAAPKKGGKQEPKSQPQRTEAATAGKRVVKLESGLTVTYN